jgi:chitosanase
MIINSEQKRMIDEILCIFETGHPRSLAAYSTVALLPDGAGISYGMHQSTDRADTLDDLLWRYLDKKGKLAFALRPFMDELGKDETALADPKNPPPWVKQLMDLLVQAGADPVMQRAQDEMFDERYWEPAFRQAMSMGLKLPLSYCVVYDSYIHGPFSTVRKLFPNVPPSRGGDEKEWTTAYVNSRYQWLATHPKKILHNTVYRMDTFIQLINSDNWKLVPSINVRGVVIS